MDEEKMELTTEYNYDIETTEAFESEIHATDLEQNVNIEEAVKTIEIESSEEIEIEVEESIGWVGGDGTKHYNLSGRDERDQHPITAITGLRDELDEIERLKTIFSDKYNHANYYKWQGAIPESTSGLFVSFHPSTNHIQVCNDTDDIFGVTVDDAAFIGGQDDTERGGEYGLVVCSGVVSVKCELNVAVGDSVVSNSYGYAQKAESGYGYKVIGVQNINGVFYAIISLGISVKQVNDLMIEFDIFGTRLGKVETDIVSAINVAQQAYNKAGNANNVSEEALKSALDAVLRAEGTANNYKEIENIVASTQQTAVQSQAVANAAVSEAGKIRGEAEKTANEALTNVNDLVAELQPITTWKYIDPITGQISEGAEYLTNYIKDGLATKAEVHTVESLTEENKTLIEENAESFRRLISSVDKYSVGEYSQAYGLSREQAKSILKSGMLYIPTKHINSDSHSEVFVGENEERWFTPGSYYEWDGSDWIEYGNSVAFSMNVPTYTEQLRYWYIDSDTALEGYEPYTLYIWKDEKWTKVNIYYNNPSNRIVSSISQDVDNISLEIVNARGSHSGLDARLTEVDSQLQLATFWNNPDSGKSNLATVKLDSSDEGSTLALVVMGQDGEEKQLKGAHIVLGQDDKESYINVEADAIKLDGYVTFTNLQENNGATFINGANIDSGTITADQINANGLYVKNGGFSGDLSADYLIIQNKEISVVSDDGSEVTRVPITWHFGVDLDGLGSWYLYSYATIESPISVDITGLKCGLWTSVISGYDYGYYIDNLSPRPGEATIIAGETRSSTIIYSYTSNKYLRDHRICTEYVDIAGNGTVLAINSGFTPSESDHFPLGTALRRWADVYSMTGTINTSDEREKNSISEIPQKYSDMFYKLNPIIYKFNSGTSDRFHVGFGAQDVERVMTECGIDSKEFAGLIKSPKADGDFIYGLRYGEFIPLNTWQIQKLKPRVTTLEEKVQALEAENAELKEQMAQLLSQN